MSRKPTTALLATAGVRLGNSAGRTGARRPSPPAPVSRPPAAAAAARRADFRRITRFAARARLTAAFGAPEYARYEDRPTPCRTAARIAKPIDHDSRDAA